MNRGEHMNNEHPTLLLGAYLLDSLDLAEREQLDRHLRQCTVCTDELHELAPLPGLLSQLTLQDLAALHEANVTPPLPSHDLFTRLTAAAERSDTTVGGTVPVRRPLVFRHPRLLVAAATVIVLAGVGAGAATWADSNHHRAGSSFSATAGSVHMGVELAAAKTGTTIRVEVTGLPVDEHCTLIAVARDGSRHRAGQWVATYTGNAKVTGSTEVAMGQLRQLVLLGTDGHRLVGVTV